MYVYKHIRMYVNIHICDFIYESIYCITCIYNFKFFFPSWSLVVLSVSANWHFCIHLLSDTISRGCAELGPAWPGQPRAPSRVPCLHSHKTGQLATVHINTTSQTKCQHVDENRFVGSALASCCRRCLLSFALASAAFGGDDASCWFKKCLRRPNLYSTNFFIVRLLSTVLICLWPVI